MNKETEKIVEKLKKDTEEFKEILNKKIIFFDQTLKKAIDLAVKSGLDLETFDYKDYGIRKVGSNQTGYSYFFFYTPIKEAFPPNIDECCGKTHISKDSKTIYVFYMDYEYIIKAIEIIPDFIERLLNILGKNKNNQTTTNTIKPKEQKINIETEELVESLKKERKELKKELNKRMKFFNQILKKAIDTAVKSELDLEMFDYDNYGIRKIGSPKTGYFHFFVYTPTYEAFPPNIDKCYDRKYLSKDKEIYIEYMPYEETMEAIEFLPEFIENLFNAIKNKK